MHGSNRLAWGPFSHSWVPKGPGNFIATTRKNAPMSVLSRKGVFIFNLKNIFMGRIGVGMRVYECEC